MEAFKYTFSKPGACNAAINYYRMAPKSRTKGPRHSIGKIEKPVLLIWVSVPIDNQAVSPVSTQNALSCATWNNWVNKKTIVTLLTHIILTVITY